MPPLDLILDALLKAIAPALAVAAVFFALIERLCGTKWAPAGSALGLTAGAALGLWLRGTLTPMSGTSAWNHLPAAAVGVMALGLATRWQRLPRAVAWIVRLVAVAGAAWWIVPENHRAEVWWLVPGFAALVIAEWALLEHLAAKPPGGAVPVCLALPAFFAVPVFLQAASGSLADSATVLSAALGGIALVAWWHRADAGAIVAGTVLFHVGLLLIGQRETSEEISWLPFALVAAAPLALVVTLPTRQIQGWPLCVLRVAVLLPPLVAALWLTGLPSFEELM